MMNRVVISTLSHVARIQLSHPIGIYIQLHPYHWRERGSEKDSDQQQEHLKNTKTTKNDFKKLIHIYIYTTVATVAFDIYTTDDDDDDDEYLISRSRFLCHLSTRLKCPKI